jgi:hypothetical protein
MLRSIMGDPSIESLLKDPEDVMDVVLDVGKPPVIHFRRDVPLCMGGEPLSSDTVHRLVSLLPKLSEDRCYLPERPTDRIAIIRGYDGMPSGISWRFAGKNDLVLPDTLRSFLERREEIPGSLLVFGKPGSGKTTMLRSIIQFSADTACRRVMVVDPYGELGLPVKFED